MHYEICKKLIKELYLKWNGKRKLPIENEDHDLKEEEQQLGKREEASRR